MRRNAHFPCLAYTFLSFSLTRLLPPSLPQRFAPRVTTFRPSPSVTGSPYLVHFPSSSWGGPRDERRWGVEEGWDWGEGGLEWVCARRPGFSKEHKPFCAHPSHFRRLDNEGRTAKRCTSNAPTTVGLQKKSVPEGVNLYPAPVCNSVCHILIVCEIQI